jgi:DNA-directed RNA polymerase specialized sigma24 family protein
LLDWARAQDNLGRGERAVFKLLAEAEAQGIVDRAGQAAFAGVTGQQADRVRAAEAASRPLFLDEPVPGTSDLEPGVPDAREDTEGSVVTSQVLRAALAAIGGLPEAARWVLALVHFYEVKVDQAAGYLGLDPDQARELHAQACLEVHQAMLLTATE